MNRAFFFLKYAFNRLRHGGQRMLIALLAIAFGVMSVVTMISVAESIGQVLVSDPYVFTGGDLRISRDTGSFGLSELDEIEKLAASGAIEAYTGVSEVYTLQMRSENSGRAYFIQSGIGIDPSIYPLQGAMTLAEDGPVSITDRLQETGSTLITRDLAAANGLKVGDRIWLSQSDGIPVSQGLTITGIVATTPDYRGHRLYYSLATARAIWQADNVFDYAVINAADPQTVAAQLEASGWYVRSAAAVDVTPDAYTSFFNTMLRGAGVLGLIVGGIGIANTMQVLLAQRRQEVGILKTLGYSRRDMLMIFVMEAGLLGIFGSIVGVTAATFVAKTITGMFASIGSMLVVWEFSLPLTLLGLFIGVATTLLFALYAIVKTSSVRPTVIFRQETDKSAEKGQWRSALGFYALLSIPFAAIAALVMGSLVEGIGVLLVALGGLIVFSLILGFTTWLLLRLMPTFRSNMLRMARNNMRKRAFSMLFAMIALFVGIFTVGFSLTMIQVGFDQFAVRQDARESHNLMVYSDDRGMPAIVQMLTENDAAVIDLRYRLTVDSLRLDGQGYYGHELQVRDSAWDISIERGPSLDEGVIGVYIPIWDFEGLDADGKEFEVVLSDGSTHTLPIIGAFSPQEQSSSLMTGTYVPVVNQQTRAALGSPSALVNIYAIVDPAREEIIAQQIGDSFPTNMTTTKGDITAEMNKTFMNVLNFALAMAGLALLAGVMLVANVVSLAMIERRYEVGVMKAVGYNQRHILILLSLEYGLIGFIASAIGIIGVQTVITVLMISQGAVSNILVMNPMTALLILVGGTLLTLVTALASAWGPSRIRPLAILNERA